MTTATPSLGELEATLNDSDKLAKLVNEGKLTDFLKGFVEAKSAANADVHQAAKEEAQRVLVQWLKDHGAKEGALGRLNLAPDASIGDVASQRSKLYNAEAPGAKIDEVVTRHRDYLKAIWYKNRTSAAQDLRDQFETIKNSFGSTVPSDGGFLIPETLRAEMLRVALESAIVRPRARVIPMESLRVPFPTIDDTSHTASVHGGMIGYWTEEAGALTDSSAKFSRIVLEAKKLTGYSEIPNELFQDSIGSFAAFIEQLWPEAISFFEDDAFFNGSGVGEPLGTLEAGCKVTVTQAGGTPNIVWADVVEMYSRMLPGSLDRAVWVASIDTFPDLAKMEISAGSPAVWMNHSLAEGPRMTLLGRPLIFSEKVPASGAAGQLNFIDFGYYLVGDRQVMQMETSEHYKFKNDQTAVRIIERVDGRPWLNSALTPKNGGDTLSPIVSLGASV